MKKYALLFIMLMAFFSACSLEEPSVTETQSDVGDLADGAFVAIGNSLTAGYQSGGLVESKQEYSYPNLIARQMGLFTFEQPTVSYPGLPPILELQDLSGTLVPASGTAVPTNTGAAAYNNLGIPGIVLADVLLSTSTQNSTDQGLSGSGLIDVVLRGQGTTVVEQALAQQPSFVTLWIGNNDVLGYATSGGTSPAAPTPVETAFRPLFNQLAAALAASGAKVAVANIPNVTDIPFFTTAPYKVDPGIGMEVPLVISTNSGPRQATENDLILITGIPIIGDDSGTYGPAGVPVGFDASAPMPNSVVLDEAEITVATTAIAAFNSVIADAATANNWALVDVNTFFAGIAAAGGVYAEQGIGMTTKFIEGELFSLDGVHPSTMGYGVIANFFIRTMNAKYGTSIAPVNLYTLREKSGSMGKFSAENVKISKGALDNTLRMLGAR